MALHNNAINATLYENLNFNFIRDIAPVASIISAPMVIDVNPLIPVKTVPEFIAYAHANPGRLNMGSGAIGTSQHIAGELFKMMTGVSIVHVPYRGGAPRLPSCSADKCRACSTLCPSRSNISEQASCARWP
jgi:tripartite-type tricarboxylate transporter receptor subunit TctC